MYSGCSSGTNSPVLPQQSDEHNAGKIQILASGTMNLADCSIDYNNRDLAQYFDVTTFVGSNFSFTIDGLIPPDIYQITLSINNVSPLTVHDVCIVFEDLYGKTVLNPDCYIDIFQPWDLDPFIAFRKEAYERYFPPGNDTEELLLKYPGGSPFVDFFIIAHLGGNTGGVYNINDWNVDGQLTEDGGSATIHVRAHDHQSDISYVVADTSVITGGITAFTPTGFPNPFEAIISNTEHAPPGTYTIPVMATSPSSPQYQTYNYFEINVVPTPLNTRFGNDVPIPGQDTLSADVNIIFTDSRSIACDGNNYYLVFANMNSFNIGYLLFTRSTDGGDTWSPAVPITNPSDESDEIHPSIVVCNDDVYIAYEYSWNSGIKVDILHSSDNGVNWTSLNPPTLVNGSYFPILAVDNNSDHETLYVTYVHNEETAGRVWVGRAFTDDLQNWDCHQVNDNTIPDISVFAPFIAFDPNFNAVMVAWENELEQRLSATNAYFDICHDWPSWGTDVKVSNAPSPREWEPRIAVNPLTGVPGIIYRRDIEGVYRDELRFTKATDRFATAFLPTINISDNEWIWVSHHSASIACSVDGRWMVASSREDDYGFPAIIYFDESLDNGVTWGTDKAINDVPDGNYAFTPVLATTGRDVCVAWSDPRSGQFEMYIDNGTY